MVSKRRALIVTKNKDTFTLLKDVMSNGKFQSISYAQKAIEAKEKLRQEKIDLVIIQTPLLDEFGVNSAREIANAFGVNVIVLVKNEIYDQTVYRLQEDKIFVVSLPTSKLMLHQCINMMNTLMYQLDLRDMEIKKLRKKIKDEKIINQAKLILIENYHWTELKAHHYLEKMAMDLSISKVNIAQDIIERVRYSEDD